jgi:hypothetical protein
MRQWMATAAAIALLAGVSTANAQNTPSSTTSKDDQKMEQSTSKQSSKQSTSKASKQHASAKKHKRHNAGTIGAGDRAGPIGGPRNDPSIHQSIQRDSRGTPKGPGSDYNK